MSYVITTRDKLQIIVSDKDGKALQDHLLTLKQPKNISISGNMYRSSEIVSIIQSNIDADPFPESHQIDGPKRYICGDRSIQYQIIKHASSKGEVAQLKNKSYRDRVYKALLTKYPKKFCDSKTGYHVCVDNPAPLDKPIATLLPA